MEGVSPTVIGPTGYGNDNSANSLGAGLLAGAALKNGYNGYNGDHYGKWLENNIMNGVCDLRHEVGETKETVKDAECNIRHDVLKAESDIRRDVAKEVGDAKFQLHDNISNLGTNTNNRFGLVDVAIVRAEYESKLATQAAIKEVNTETRHQAERLQDRTDAFERRVTDKLCDFERRVDSNFTTISKELAECCCEMKLIATRQEATATAQTGLLNTIVSALNVNK